MADDVGGLVMELLRGRESAAQLQTLLNRPVEDRGTVSIKDLAVQISTSFRVILSQLQSEPPQIAAGGSARSPARKASAIQNRRGCYKRRKTSESWERVSQVMEDGYVWRKYGQKVIMNFRHPRCYFRCTYKHQGCTATKQVQLVEETPPKYQTTYFHSHTCQNDNLIFAPKFDEFGQDLEESNLLSFQANLPLKQHLHHSQDSVEEASLTKEGGESQSEGFSGEKLSLEPWTEVLELGQLEYRPEFAPLSGSLQDGVFSHLSSCASSSSHWPEFGQIGDMDDFSFLTSL